MCVCALSFSLRLDANIRSGVMAQLYLLRHVLSSLPQGARSLSLPLQYTAKSRVERWS